MILKIACFINAFGFILNLIFYIKNNSPFCIFGMFISLSILIYCLLSIIEGEDVDMGCGYGYDYYPDIDYSNILDKSRKIFTDDGHIIIDDEIKEMMEYVKS